MEIGSLLRQIRTNKALTLADVADEAISSSYLSKVERGQNDITVTKLIHLLRRLETTPEEFLYLVANGLRLGYGDRDRLLETYFGKTTAMSIDPKKIPQIIQALQLEEEKAQIVFEKAPSLKHKLAVNGRAILAALFQSLFVEDRHELPVRPDLTHVAEQYLQRLDNWGELDLYFYILFSIAMPAATQRRLSTIAIKRSHYYRHFTNTPLLLLNLLENQVMLEMTRQDNQAAAHYLAQLEKALDKQPSAEFALWARFHKAELYVRNGHHKQAATLLEQNIQMATTLKLRDLADMFSYACPIILTEPPTSVYKYFHIMIGTLEETA
ncbi:transcriptional regulator [Lacticaseibacillus chiayiensis]|uniref:Helix-turn-helix domain-containing protein n=1 Tax=Lacticaseibacillus chiayiensis TaxID=2100821 RepID=A0A4Q1TZ47_9LACO|nr:helix-turn-helix transcriptional regulator [Lacticaseibacillus chiayiensis]QVI35317.1 helix-turn-helix transcriptional regulator [Lacticaseibacillus chiayiensis]RXT23525.1 transcriptional regulator [Lacticaseibacillus chiayiensis]UYN57098.1 helix-turn-helix domain-containing protein [Lacticaseibacillus chiayiensis]